MLNLKVVISVLGLLVVSACTTSNRRSVIAMKIDDQQAHVAMGNSEVRPGDRVEILKNVCKKAPGGRLSGLGYDPSCEMVRVGQGTIEQVLGSDYSVMKVNQGVEFEEGFVVEKR